MTLVTRDGVGDIIALVHINRSAGLLNGLKPTGTNSPNQETIPRSSSPVQSPIDPLKFRVSDF